MHSDSDNRGHIWVRIRHTDENYSKVYEETRQSDSGQSVPGLGYRMYEHRIEFFFNYNCTMHRWFVKKKERKTMSNIFWRMLWGSCLWPSFFVLVVVVFWVQQPLRLMCLCLPTMLLTVDWPLLFTEPLFRSRLLDFRVKSSLDIDWGIVSVPVCSCLCSWRICRDGNWRSAPVFEQLLDSRCATMLSHRLSDLEHLRDQLGHGAQVVLSDCSRSWFEIWNEPDASEIGFPLLCLSLCGSTTWQLVLWSWRVPLALSAVQALPP